MTDLEMHLEVLSRLQEYGFCIEIDDFGSGYSSLNMLKDIRLGSSILYTPMETCIL